MNIVCPADQKAFREVPGLSGDFVDMSTIRRRVARIKSGWSKETAQARAVEGARRREQLESMVLDMLTDTSLSEESCSLKEYGFREHGFCLVG